MIDENGLIELRKELAEKWQDTAIPVSELIVTCEALWPIARAAEGLVAERYFGRGSVGFQYLYKLKIALRKLYAEEPKAELGSTAP